MCWFTPTSGWWQKLIASHCPDDDLLHQICTLLLIFKCCFELTTDYLYDPHTNKKRRKCILPVSVYLEHNIQAFVLTMTPYYFCTSVHLTSASGSICHIVWGVLRLDLTALNDFPPYTFHQSHCAFTSWSWCKFLCCEKRHQLFLPFSDASWKHQVHF